MDYQPTPNLLLEALAYLGRKAGGYTGQYIANRLQLHGVMDLSPFWADFAPVKRLSELLDARVRVPQQQLTRLFANLPGFPYSPIGAYSVAFLMFYPVLTRYDGDFSALLDEMRAFSPEHITRQLMFSLELNDTAGDPAGRFMAGIQALDIPSDSKLLLVDSLHRYRAFLEEAAACLAPLLAELEAQGEALGGVLRPFSEQVAAEGPEAYLRHASSLSPATVRGLRPFLFGLDTNLTVEPFSAQERGGLLVYGGTLRQCILTRLSSAKDEATAVYEAIKLLGDRTRFDILLFLRDRAAYGQELSDHFGLARNTIHHHMSKLASAGLVTCTVDGNRVYYTVDKSAADRLLIRQRQLLIGGHWPAGHLT